MSNRPSIQPRSAPCDIERDIERDIEDTAISSLTREDRERLSMDAWEPSLLRELLTAHNKLDKERTD